jgi:short subunit dehydrogenase-like uncharacterized protein
LSASFGRSEVPRLDVVILGASGVTGGNALPYLARRATELGRSWGIAGRDPQLLMRSVADLPADIAQPEILEADVTDEDSLREIARATKVLVNAVGPYRLSADAVIRACIAAGTDYLDVAGETDVIAEMIALHHVEAEDAGVRIVQGAGYEALPFDLAVQLGSRAAEARGAQMVAADVIASISFPSGIPRPSDGVSGGTFQSTVAAIRGDGIPALLDPASLVTDRADAAAVRRHSPLGLLPRLAGTSVLIPMVPSPFTNPQIIHRTQSLLRTEGRGATTSFRYREGIALAEGLLTLPLQLAAALPLGAAGLGVQLLARITPAPVRRATAAVLQAVGPSAGTGPRADRLEGWSWRLEVLITATDGVVDHVVVDADAHPGYLATSRMIAEAGLLLADEDAKLPARRGHLTPALAFGTDELARFANAGVRFRAA